MTVEPHNGIDTSITALIIRMKTVMKLYGLTPPSTMMKSAQDDTTTHMG